MSAPRPLEAELLNGAETALQRASAQLPSQQLESRLQVLEACASRFGGFDLAEYQQTFGIAALCEPRRLLRLAEQVAGEIEKTPIHPALALSALARETLGEADRRVTGAYHTDFRLATRLAGLAGRPRIASPKVIDPACGAGILLAALTVENCGRDRAKTAKWLGESVCAADRSANSLRGALLALASLTDDLPALTKMRKRWFCGDSLIADMDVWTAIAPNGFDVVIGNPPWEKVKLSRHEFLRSAGVDRHYGADTSIIDTERFHSQRAEIASYSKQLLARYPDLGCGEPDLYIAFTELFLELCRAGGVVAALVPGGLIRSQGTEAIRRKLLGASQRVSVSVIENRARFFQIDTRFKFLAVSFVKRGKKSTRSSPIVLLHERGTPDGLVVYGSAAIGRESLGRVRGDYSLPEVRSRAEWRIFQTMFARGCSWDDMKFGWCARFCREVDMTKERPKFIANPQPGALPLVEGRMVHQHRFGVKGYVSGSGRRAVWAPMQIGAGALQPQFWIKRDDVPPGSVDRIDKQRIGFCDIAGQTNERSLMAAIIPAGVVCGNKVPTILFPDDPSEDRLLAWVAIANSIPFDWMLRRVLTTTVNYFLLQSIALPRLTKNGLSWRRLVAGARELRELDTAGASPETRTRMARLRAEIDAEVAVTYGLELSDVELILRDFPILDRGQPPITGESKSTITRDTILAAVAKRTGRPATHWLDRVASARGRGAEAYMPSELGGPGDESDTGREVSAND